MNHKLHERCYKKFDYELKIITPNPKARTYFIGLYIYIYIDKKCCAYKYIIK